VLPSRHDERDALAYVDEDEEGLTHVHWFEEQDFPAEEGGRRERRERR